MEVILDDRVAIVFRRGQGEVSARVAVALAKLGKIDEAFNRVEDIKDWAVRCQALIDLARELVSIGSADKAKLAFGKIIDSFQDLPDDESRSGALVRLAGFQAQLGDYKGAWEHALGTHDRMTGLPPYGQS